MNCTDIDDSGSGQWHVIFRSGNDDYCRMDFKDFSVTLSNMVQDAGSLAAPCDNIDTIDGLKRQAEALFKSVADSTARRVVTSYRLERW